MASRLELHEVLCKILRSRNVYFQPPASVKMQYPAIVYERSDIQNTPANNGVYLQSLQYQVTVIDKNPDSEIVAGVSKLPRCSFDTHFTADNLNHDVFTLYF